MWTASRFGGGVNADMVEGSDNMSDSLLPGRGRSRQRILGLREELVAEIAAVSIGLTGLLIFLSLASNSPHSNWVGSIGRSLSWGLTFLFGRYVAYLVPFLVLGWGVVVWKGRHLRHVPERLLGLFLAATCVCGLLAVGHSDSDLRLDHTAYLAGGALGNFLMHRECLHLAGYLGGAGTYLLLLGVLVISTCVLTDSQLRPTLRRVAALRVYLARERWEPLWLRLRDWWRINAQQAGLSTEPDAAPQYGPSRETLAPPPGFPPVRSSSAPAPAVSAPVESRPAAEFRRPASAPAPASSSYPPLSARPASEPVTPRSAPVPAPTPLSTERVEQRPAPQRSSSEPVSFSPAFAPTHTTPPCDDDMDVFATENDWERPPIPSGGEAIQEDFALLPEYELPPLDMLNTPPQVETRMSEEEMTDASDKLEKTLSEFGISAQVVQVTQGPTVTRFELQPAPGVKVSRIASLENDITMCMKAESVRIIAPVPGKGTVGLEIPNRKPTPVFLREILNSDAFRNHPSPLAFALGKTISAEPYVCDLAAMPHLLIAGTTGSGKSVCLNSVICSILFRMTPDLVKFIMIDPKRVELNVYQAIPHLLAPVVCEPRKAAAALTWAIEQMEERYKKLATLGVRNIDGYNAIVRSPEPHPKAIGRKLEYMPHIVIVIDELADLMIIAKNEVEDSIIRLAQMSRAVGMHLILATQRPSVNVITGIIKANFPSRVAFQVSSKVDSRTILDSNGAEMLLGRGDMLFSPGGSPKPIRLQGCYLSDSEVERVADWVRAQQQAMYVKQDFATAQEIAEQRQAAAEEMGGGRGAGRGGNGGAPRRGFGDGGLSLDGVDADDSRVPMDDSDEDYDDYSYRQERLDGRSYGDTAERRGGGDFAYGRSVDDTDAIDDELFRQAVKCILVHKKASVSLLQRKLKIGFARAGRVMDMIEEAGIVGPNVGSKVREITVDPEEYLAQMEGGENAGF